MLLIINYFLIPLYFVLSFHQNVKQLITKIIISLWIWKKNVHVYAQVRKWMANKRMRSGNTMPSLSKRSRSRLRPSDLLKGRSIGQLGGGTINVGAVPMQNDIIGEGRVKDGILKSEIK